MFFSPPGFVQTPLYDGARRYLNEVRDPWVRVAVPDGHVIMVSFPWGEVHGRLTVVTNATNSSYCFGEFPLPSVHSTPFLSLHFRHKCTYFQPQAYRGFRMRFSFHSDPAIPERLEDGAWNCSVPHWPDFEHHVSCNLHRDCRGGEDEVVCPYYSERCGAGYMAAGDTCLFHAGRQAAPLTWLQASDLCVGSGGRLATLKTERLVDAALRIFQPSKFDFMAFYVGIRRAPTGLPVW